MRLATFTLLVLRRIWARRLMLSGSFLGATLVSALLVVLPLYEGSVAAVDLLYTFRQAPTSAVGLRAVHTTNEYTPGQSDSARQAVLDAAAPMRTWYPDLEERTLSREFTVISLDLPDWLGMAAGWRAAGGPDSGEAAPYPTPPREPIQTRILTSPDLAAWVEMVAGELTDDPDPGADSEPLLRVVLGEDLARLARLGVGDRLVLRPFLSLPETFEIAEVSGIARPADPTDAIWDQVRPGHLVLVDQRTFEGWSGTFMADPGADPWLRRERGFRRIGTGQTFTLFLDREAVTVDNVEQLTRGVVGFTAEVARAEGIRTLTRLPAVVSEFEVRTVVLGAPILAMLALIVTGALYFLIYAAALIVEREGNEMALLRLRGASSWQTTGLHLLQSALIALAAVALAPAVARFMVGMTGRIPPLSTLTGGEALAVSPARPIVPFAVAGGIAAFVAMGLAVLPAARSTILELRALGSRPVRQSVWQRHHLDLFLVVIAGILLWELNQRGLVAANAADGGLDPLSVAAPALFLFAGALLLLRVLPWLLRGVGWVMTRTKGMTGALPGWHLGRNPIPYGRLALLVWLTTGFGAFALTYAATLEASYEDRAAFVTGSDLRLVGRGLAGVEEPEGAVITPVYRGLGAPRLVTRSAELLAIEPETFTRVTAWRPDFGASTAAQAVGPEVLGPPVDWGIDLPLATQAIRVDGVLVPEPAGLGGRELREKSPLRLVARVVDEEGRLRVHAATASFDDRRWATVEIPLAGDAALNGPFPDSSRLILQSLWLEGDGSPGSDLEPGRVLLHGWTAVVPSGPVDLAPAIAEEFTAWQGMEVGTERGSLAAEIFLAVTLAGAEPTAEQLAASPLYRPEEEVTVWSFPRRTRGQQVPHLRAEAEPIRVVLDTFAARAAGLGVGSEAVFGVDAERLPGTVAGMVSLVPTTGDPRYGGVMIVRLDALTQWISGNPRWSLGAGVPVVLEPQELWVSADDPNEALRSLLAGLEAEPDEVITATGVAADFSGRPIQVGLVSILLVGTGAGVLLALAGVTGYVLVAVRRRHREMGVLRALGFPRRGVAGTFAVEQLVVLGLGAVIGVGAGIGLMRLMVPFLQLGEEGTELVPAATMQIPVARLGVYLAVVALLLVVSVLASTRSVSARRLSEVLREVER